MAYTEPTPADLKARYPAFADVADATVQVYLDDTATSVDGGWMQGDYIPAKTALAAHNMALAGLGVQSETDGYAAAGVNRIRSGNFDVSFSESKVAAASGGGLDATVYGRAYLVILRRNRRGPRFIAAPFAPYGYGPLAQQNDGDILPWGS